MSFIRTLDDIDKKFRHKVVLKGDLEKNELFLGDNVVMKGEVVFDFRGKASSRIHVGNNSELHNVTMATNGSGCSIEINEGCKWKGFLLAHGKGSSITVGKNSTSIESYILARDSNVIIGDRCLFSRDVEIRTSDSHKIFNKGTREQLNTPSGVVIGDHVWIAANSVVSKGAEISSESVVGAMSFVNKKFANSNVILAGAPAKVIKTGIEWER